MDDGKKEKIARLADYPNKPLKSLNPAFTNNLSTLVYFVA
jgi:hypothetical protein